MKTAIIKLGEILKQEPLGLVGIIDEQNKLQKKTLNPIMIQITGSEVADNSEEIAKAVSLMEESVEEVCQNALSLGEVTDTKKNLAAITTFLVESRKEITAPLDKIKGKFTPLEARMKKLIDDLKSKEDQIKEQDYQIAQNTIENILMDTINAAHLEYGISISMKVFADFIANKRKIKGMIPNEKGKLPAASTRQIQDQFDLVANPLIEAKKLENLKGIEQNKLAKDLSNIPLTGTVAELEASIVNLKQIKEGVELYYPNIMNDATRQIDANIRIIEANIRAESANAQKVEQESNDETVMKEFKKIDFDTSNIDYLSDNLAQARELRSKLLLADNIRIIDEIGGVAKTKLTELKAAKFAPQPTQEPEPVQTEDPVTEKTIYMISLDDLEVLSGIKVEADSQEDAKKIFVSHFMTHLSMIDLKEIK